MATTTTDANSGMSHPNNKMMMTWREEYGVSVEVPVFYPSKHPDKEQRKISLEEVAQHADKESCWFVIHGRVYDATKFVKNHPGGWLPMKALAGKADATDAFEAYHPARVHSTLLPSMFIGVLDIHGKNVVKQTPPCCNESKCNASELDECSRNTQIDETKEETKEEEALSGKDEAMRKQEEKVEVALREVRQDLLKRNLFFTSTSYYLKMYSWQFSLLTVAVALTLSKTYWILGAVVMGIFWQQTAFVGHDIGHNAVLGNRENNLFWGILIGNTLMGISLGWWKQSHNVHHVVCNSVEHDPDIQHLPVFAVSDKIFNKGGFFSTYHKKRFDIDFFARFLVSIQHLLFYPVMAVARINLYAQSWINLIIQPHGPVPYRYLEMATLLMFFCWVGALVSTLDTPEQRWAWIAISHAVSGLLHVQICLSHFPMDAHREGDTSRALGWFSMQMQTSMNVETYTFFDWVHGGLQFQVEHHMFPRLPRHNLREARRLVRESLIRVGALDKYNEMGFVKGNLYLLSTMRAAAKEAAKLRKGDAGLYVSPLFNGLNLEG